jgi:hypothetical protein
MTNHRKSEENSAPPVKQPGRYIGSTGKGENQHGLDTMFKTENYTNKDAFMKNTNKIDSIAQHTDTHVNEVTGNESYRDIDLNLFAGEQQEALEELETLKAWQEITSGRDLRILCNLDQDRMQNRNTIAAYLKLARCYPQATFLLETKDPTVFQDVYPAGEFYPDNVWLGGIVTEEDQWNEHAETLFPVVCAFRYLHVYNPDWKIEIKDHALDIDTGLGLSWVILEFDAETNTASDQTALVPFLNEADHWGVPVFVEGLILNESLFNPKETDSSYYTGPLGKEFPYGLYHREPEWRENYELRLNVWMRDLLTSRELPSPLQQQFEICAHAFYMTETASQTVTSNSEVA